MCCVILVGKALEAKQDLDMIAEQLCNLAVRLGSSDNITTIIIQLIHG